MDFTPHLDAKDKRLLFELSGNSRQSTSELARKVGLGRDLVAYRLKRLATERIVTACTASINPYTIGFTLFKTYLRLRNNPARVAELKAVLKKHDRVYCLAECDGSWDILFNTLAQHPFEFYRIQEGFLSDFHDIIIATNVSTVVNHWYFSKKYLFRAPPKTFHVGGDPRREPIDRADTIILHHLAGNARISTTELAERTKLTTPTVVARIERLEALGILLGYRIEVDRSKLGLTYFKARIMHTDNRKRDFARLRTFAESHPAIAYMIEQIGDCKVELAIEARDLHHFNEILDELRREFAQLIGNIETILVRNDTYKWLPAVW